jgi:pimeloyl-ACP methyl ester carboxylesterase
MKTTLLSSRWLLLLLTIWCLGGCDNSNDPDPNPALLTGEQLFVAADSVTTIPKAQLQALATLAGFGAFTAQLKYDVTFWKFRYKTTYQGQLLEVSGMLAVPRNMPVPPALLSAQHGTMFKYSDAPSNFPATFTGFELFASTGFVTLIPDYIGLGVSSNIRQSFYDKPSTAGTVVDMIKAAKYHLQKKKVALNPRLFLVGYSEGGYATMATQQAIETTPEYGLTVTAAAAGAGGYDLPGMLSSVAATPTYATPAFLGLFLQAYNTTYSWNRPLTDFFQAPYATALPALLNGTKTRAEIDAALTNSPAALFTPTFYASLSNPSAEPTLKQRLQENSFFNWVPTSPTRLYHGTADGSVFFSTSQSTYDRFRAAGATNVTFTPIPGGTHESSIIPMMADALPWLQSLNP